MSFKYKFQAGLGLLKHYKYDFRHHWKNRKQLGGGIFNLHEEEFLPAALALQEKPVSPAGRFVAKTLIALVIFVITWSIFGKVDIVVNATGKIIPSSRTKTIASVDVASVRALHVEEGQSVKAGEVLIELDTSTPDAERDKAVADGIVATLQVARSKALIVAVDSLQPPQLPRLENVPEDKWQAAQRQLDEQYQDFLAKLNRFDGDIQRYEQALPLAAQQARDYQDLTKDHDVSTDAYLEKEQARIDLEGELTDAKNQRAALLTDTKSQAYEDLTDGAKMVEESRQDALKADVHSKLLKLTAPVDGTVQQ
jgi:hemolysin D